MLRAKPYHSLLAHLEDAYGVFQLIWEQNRECYQSWCNQYQLDPNEVYLWLGWGVFLHDIGKANPIWQTDLQSNRKSGVSHPLLSFALLWEWYARAQGPLFYTNPLYRSVMTAVLAHHHMLHNHSYQRVGASGQTYELPVQECNAILQLHYERLGQSFTPFRENELKWTGAELANKVREICKCVNSYNPFDKQELKRAKAMHTFFLSIICQADHIASALSQELYEKGRLDTEKPAINQIDQQTLHNYFPNPSLHVENAIFQSPNELQQAIIEQISPSMVLRAGCGEGKTGAALWFARYFLEQKKANRVIFTLPTRFTINSMYQDFTHPDKYGFQREQVGIYHSDAIHFLKKRAEETKEDLGNNWSGLRSEVFKNNIFQKTINLTTIDHLLYSVLHCHKHADLAFGNIQQSVIIFDELHYYEDVTLQKIGECFRLLKEMNIPHLIMSATLPDSFMQSLDKGNRKKPYLSLQYKEKVQVPFFIEKAGAPLYTKDSGISGEAMRWITDHLPYRQMIVVNQVERAKAITKTLRERYSKQNILCYHSEFSPKDRDQKERCIKILFKPTNKRSEEEKKYIRERGYLDNDQVILVSTQISELSLDISADIQLSDLAPIDAMSQRGGRLHRKGNVPLADRCQCQQCESKNKSRFTYKQIVFPLEEENKNAGYPYVDQTDWMEEPANVLKQSWNIIGKEYSFANVKDWVNQLYPTYCQLVDKQMRDYILEDAVFGKRPAERFGGDYNGEESQGSFQVRESRYRTVEVLPSIYRQEILDQIFHQLPTKKIGDILKDYMVPMKAYRFFQGVNEGWVVRDSPTDNDELELIFINVPYDPMGIGFDFEAGPVAPINIV